jgi:hypothetical protein
VGLTPPKAVGLGLLPPKRFAQGGVNVYQPTEQSVKSLRCIQKLAKHAKFNFDVHLIQYCFYFPNLVCPKFDFDLGFSVCQDKSGSVRCCWLPSWVKDGYHLAVLRGGILCV